MRLGGGEGDAPKKGQRGAKTNDAKRGHPFWREPVQISALQDQSIQKPNSDRAHDLYPRQRFAHKETTDQTERVKSESPPEQSRDRREKIRQGREMIKNRMQMVRLELPLLDQVHHAGNASEGKRAVGDKRDGRVKFQPRVRAYADGVWFINRREQRKKLKQNHQRRGEGAHQ